MRPQESYFDSEVVMLLQVLEHIDESIALLVHGAVVAQEGKFHHTKHVETQRSSTRCIGLAEPSNCKRNNTKLYVLTI
jgi:hypothetical protein